MRRLALVAASLAALAGCASEREVLVRLPISRLELPEQGPRRLDITLARTTEVEALLTRDQANVPPNPTAPELSEQGDAMLRFDAAVHPAVTVSLKAISGLGGVQAKLMPLQGRGPFAVAFTLNYAGGDDAFDFDDVTTQARTNVEGRLRDYAAILGWKVDPSLSIYGGPWYSNLHYRGHHFSDRGTNPDIDLDYSGELTAHGANIGLATTFRRWGRLLLEYSQAKVKGGAVEDDFGHGALSFEVFFGPLVNGGGRVPDKKEPAEVVPPEPEKEKD